MARAKRYFIPGYVWHITHRCHNAELNNEANSFIYSNETYTLVVQKGLPIEACERSTALDRLAVSGKETIWSACIKLHINVT